MFARLSPVLVLASGLAIGACGPRFTVEPLIGEDPEVLQVIGVSGEDLEVPETVAAVEQFYRALWTNQTSVMWGMLSRETRSALDQHALKADTNGRTLLQTRMFPRLEGEGRVKVSLGALFLVRRPIRFTQQGEVGPTDDRAVVVAANRMGNKREVQLVRERGAWVIHHPELTELPPSVNLQPKLLPADRAPEPETPDIDPEAPDIEPEPGDPEDLDPTPPTRPRHPDLDF